MLGSEGFPPYNLDMGNEQATVAIGYLGFQLVIIISQLLISVYLAKRIGLRKRWGLLGFPMLAITAQLFRLISPALRFLEPMVTKIVEPMGQSGVVGVFVVATIVVFLISLAVVYAVLTLLKKKGFR